MGIVEMHTYKAKVSYSNRLARVFWSIVYWLLYFPSPNIFFIWRVMLLKLFGANVKWNSRPYPRAKIWLPSQLVMGSRACIANGVIIYNVARVVLGDNTVISERARLITATKSFSGEDRCLKVGEISIGNDVWLASDVFIAPGLSVGRNSVVLSQVNLLEDIPENIVVKPIRNYLIEQKR